MKNFNKLIAIFVIMASLTAAFGAVVYRVFTQSVKFYGLQPGDARTMIVALVIFSAFVGVCGFMLRQAIDWLIWSREFKSEFGFKAPHDPQDPFYHSFDDLRAVESTLKDIHRFNSREKYVSTALLGEKFGYRVQWPAELQQEYARTHR